MLSGASGHTTGAPGLTASTGIDHRGQHLVVDHDRFGRGLRLHARGRHHGGNGFAGKAHDLMGEQAPRRHRHRLAVGALEDVEVGMLPILSLTRSAPV